MGTSKDSTDVAPGVCSEESGVGGRTAEGQGGEGVLEDLLEAEEFYDGEVYSGVEP